MKTAGRFLLGASVLVGIAVSITSAALADRSVRDTVYPHAADLALGGEADPSGATVGHLAAVNVLVENRGPGIAKNVVLTARLPTLATYVGVNQSTGTCAQFDGTLTCPLGEIPRYIQAQVQILLRMPTVPGPQVTSVKVKGSTLDLVKSNNTRDYTVNALARSQDSVSEFVQAPGATMSTGHKTSPTNPTSSTVNLHTDYDGGVTLAEHSTTDTAAACGSGFTCFGQYVTVGFLSGNSLKPHILTVTWNPSELPRHRSITHTRVFNYGSIVPKCSATSNGAAKPDPCVVSRTVLSDGSWQIVVRYVYGAEVRLGGGS